MSIIQRNAIRSSQRRHCRRRAPDRLRLGFDADPHPGHGSHGPAPTSCSASLPKYAGIGATIGDFTHDNNMFCLNCSLSPGEAAYTIKGRRRGRVTEYAVTEDFKPAASAAVRLSLVSGTMIPGPITAPVRQSANCIDYRVPQLKKLVGLGYAEASTSPGVNFATMQAVPTPTCP